MRLEQLSLDEWTDALPSTGFEPFHLPEALGVLDDHVDAELRLYGGFKGEQAVGLLPMFVKQQGLGTAALSPPPSYGVPRLGPVLMPTSPKRRKCERVNGAFSEAVLEDVDANSSRTLVRMSCHSAYLDPRPYVWANLDVDVAFTYRLDLSETTPDDLLRSFSKSLRREIRDAQDLDLTVEVGGEDALRTVYDRTRERYAEQGRGFTLSWPYVRDLAAALDDRFRVYVLRGPDGAFLSGIAVVYSNDAAYFWLGGARTTYENVGVNSLLHWHILEDLFDSPPRSSISQYDLMGANTERLCRYKSKFGADLIPYYVLESSGTSMAVAKTAYRLLNR